MSVTEGAATRFSPRETRTGLSPEVIAAGPPPLPTLPSPWGLRFARADGHDLDLIHKWMNAPHVAKFWDQAWPKQRWAEELETQLAGDYSRPFILTLDGREMGYVELYRAARDVIAAHYPALPNDLGVHGAIGEPDLAGQGLAYRFWVHLIKAVFEVEPGCRRLVTDPDAGHRVARRLDEGVARKMGGRLMCEADLPHKRAALYVYPRTPADLPD